MTEQSQLGRIEAIVLQNAQAIQQSNERMGRIEAMVVEDTQAIASNHQSVTELTETVRQQGERQESILYETQRLLRNVGEKVDRADATSQANRTSLETLVRMMQAIQVDILRLQNDVKGLQIENQRIVYHLFGETR